MGNFLLVLGTLHVFGHAHVRSIVSPGMDWSNFTQYSSMFDDRNHFELMLLMLSLHFPIPKGLVQASFHFIYFISIPFSFHFHTIFISFSFHFIFHSYIYGGLPFSIADFRAALHLSTYKNKLTKKIKLL